MYPYQKGDKVLFPNEIVKLAKSLLTGKKLEKILVRKENISEEFLDYVRDFFKVKAEELKKLRLSYGM